LCFVFFVAFELNKHKAPVAVVTGTPSRRIDTAKTDDNG
jgi:hypothetical protein